MKCSLISNRSVVSTLLLLAFLSIAASFVKAQEREFQEISKVPQDVSGLRFPSKCPKFGKIAKVMYTIEPSDDDTVKVSTYPANLVTASKQNGNLLQLEFNKDVAYDSNEGGVQIYFPASQLKSVNVAADSVAQILDGFTNIDSLRVSSDAKLYATMLSGSDNKDENDEAYRLRDLSVSSDAQAFVLSNYNIKNVKVSSDGQLTLQSPMVKDVRVSSDAVLKMKGNITSAKVSSDGKLTLDGNVVGDGNVEVTSDAGVTIFGSVSSSTSVRVSSDGNFNVGAELAASVEVTSDGRVRAPNCNTVSTRSDGKCIVDNNINGSVNVSVDTLPLTRKGTEHCGSFSSWQGSRKGKFWSIFGVACAVVVCYVCYRRCKNCPEKDRGIVTPTVQIADAYVVEDDRHYVPKAINGAEKEAPSTNRQDDDIVVKAIDKV